MIHYEVIWSVVPTGSGSGAGSITFVLFLVAGLVDEEALYRKRLVTNNVTIIAAVISLFLGVITSKVC